MKKAFIYNRENFGHDPIWVKPYRGIYPGALYMASTGHNGHTYYEDREGYYGLIKTGVHKDGLPIYTFPNLGNITPEQEDRFSQCQEIAAMISNSQKEGEYLNPYFHVASLGQIERCRVCDEPNPSYAPSRPGAEPSPKFFGMAEVELMTGGTIQVPLEEISVPAPGWKWNDERADALPVFSGFSGLKKFDIVSYNGRPFTVLRGSAIVTAGQATGWAKAQRLHLPREIVYMRSIHVNGYLQADKYTVHERIGMYLEPA